MKKIISISMISASLLMPNLFAEELSMDLKEGWNLVGTNLNVASMKSDISNIDKIESLWTFDGGWTLYKDETFTGSLDAGKGFWIKASNTLSITLSGSEAESLEVHLKEGWTLNSPLKDTEISKFKANSDIANIWTFKDGWFNYNSEELMQIKTGVGFWAKATTDTTISYDESSSETTVEPTEKPEIEKDNDKGYYDEERPPSLIVLENEKNHIEPLVNAKVYNLDGEYLGLKTDKAGSISIDDLKAKDVKIGDILFITKDGYQAIKVKVNEVGEAVPISKIDKSTPLSGGKIVGDFNIAPPTVIQDTLGNAGVEYSRDALSDKGDITISSIPIESASDVKIKVEDASELSIVDDIRKVTVIGGANFTIKSDVDGEIVPVELGVIDGLGLSLKQTSFLGNLEEMLNGFTGEDALKDRAQDISKETYEKLQEAIENEIFSFYAIQQNPETLKWEYKAKAEFKEASDGTYYMQAEEDAKFNSFGTILFIAKTDKIEGTLNVCVKSSEYKYPDGHFEDMEEEEIVKNAIITGGDNVITQFEKTDANGCLEVSYRVPFLSPTFPITAQKEHFYIKTQTINIEKPEKDENQVAKEKSVDIYLHKKPPYSSIWGYVLDKITEDGIPNANVFLLDPQILTKDKVKFDGKRITLMYSEEFKETRTYTWKLLKDGKEVTTIKSGKERSDSYISEDEIMNLIVNPFNATSSQDKVVENPIGDYTIAITVNNQRSNENLIEEGFVDFKILMDEYAFKIRTSNSISQGNAPIYKADGTKVDIDTETFTALNEDGTKINGLSTYSLYGGKDIGYWYAMSDAGSRDADEHNWTASVIAYASLDDGSAVEGVECINTKHEPSLNSKFTDYCYSNVFENSDILERKSEYRNAFLMSYFNNNFLSFLKPDVHPAANSMPYLMSGVGVYVTYHRAIEINGETYYSDVPSTTAINSKDEGGFSSVLEAVKIDNMTLHLNDSLGFKTVKTKSSDEPMGDENKEGYYEFKYLLPPSISDKLEIRALAEGYRVGEENRIGIESKIDAYQKARYDFYLINADADIIGDTENKPEKVKKKPIKPNSIWFGFERSETLADYGWGVEDIGLITTSGVFSTPSEVTWQIVNNDNLPLTNAYFKGQFGEEQGSILPTADGKKYAWFGNIATGTYTDSGEISDSTSPVGKVLVSPLIDFANIPLAKASVKAWYEVSSQDYDYDTAFIGFMVDASADSDGDGVVSLDWITGPNREVEVGKAYMKRVTPVRDYMQPPKVPNQDEGQVSNMGVNVEPQWKTYEIPLNFLAGKKAHLIFGFLTADSKNNNLRGFGVDSILIHDDVATSDKDSSILPPMPPNMTKEDFENFKDEVIKPNQDSFMPPMVPEFD